MHATRVLRAVSKANPTGFDIKKYSRAAGTPVYDPWERNESWRYTGQFSRWNRFRSAFPGLGTATVAFAGYCVYEHFLLEDKHPHVDHHAKESNSKNT